MTDRTQATTIHDHLIHECDRQGFDTHRLLENVSSRVTTEMHSIRPGTTWVEARRYWMEDGSSLLLGLHTQWVRNVVEFGPVLTSRPEIRSERRS